MIDFLEGDQFGYTRIPVAPNRPFDDRTKAEKIVVRPIIATLSGDYCASNVWALQAPVRVSNESTFEA
jgi:cobalamin synthase